MRLPAQLLDFHLQGFAGAALALKVLFDTRERKRLVSDTIRLRLHGGELCVRPLQVLLRTSFALSRSARRRRTSASTPAMSTPMEPVIASRRVAARSHAALCTAATSSLLFRQHTDTTVPVHGPLQHYSNMPHIARALLVIAPRCSLQGVSVTQLQRQRCAARCQGITRRRSLHIACALDKLLEEHDPPTRLVDANLQILSQAIPAPWDTTAHFQPRSRRCHGWRRRPHLTWKSCATRQKQVSCVRGTACAGQDRAARRTRAQMPK